MSEGRRRAGRTPSRRGGRRAAHGAVDPDAADPSHPGRQTRRLPPAPAYAVLAGTEKPREGTGGGTGAAGWPCASSPCGSSGGGSRPCASRPCGSSGGGSRPCASRPCASRAGGPRGGGSSRFAAHGPGFSSSPPPVRPLHLPRPVRGRRYGFAVRLGRSEQGGSLPDDYRRLRGDGAPVGLRRRRRTVPAAGGPCAGAYVRIRPPYRAGRPIGGARSGAGNGKAPSHGTVRDSALWLVTARRGEAGATGRSHRRAE